MKAMTEQISLAGHPHITRHLATHVKAACDAFFARRKMPVFTAEDVKRGWWGGEIAQAKAKKRSTGFPACDTHQTQAGKPALLPERNAQ